MPVHFFVFSYKNVERRQKSFIQINFIFKKQKQNKTCYQDHQELNSHWEKDKLGLKMWAMQPEEQKLKARGFQDQKRTCINCQKYSAKNRCPVSLRFYRGINNDLK